MADPGLYLFSGLNRAGNAITEGMQNFDRLKKEDKVAKALFDALTPDEDPLTGEMPAHPMRINKDAFNAMSAKDRIAATQGFMKATALQEAAQEMQMKREALQRMVASEKALKSAFQTASQPTSEEAEAVGPGAMPITAQRLMQVISQQQPAALGNQRLPQLLEMLNESQAGGAPMILPGPYPGTKLVTDARGRATPQVVTDPDVKARMTKHQQAKIKVDLGEQIQGAMQDLSDAEGSLNFNLTGPDKGRFDELARARVAGARERLEQAIAQYEEITGEKFKAKAAEKPSAPSTGRITIKSIRQK